MSDLVERLRQTAQGLAFICMGEDDPPSAIGLMSEAADEIERLRALRNDVIEECAMMADTLVSLPSNDKWDAGCQFAAKHIASTIRSLKKD